MLLIRLYGVMLTICAIGACTDDSLGAKPAIVMLTGGISCLTARGGFLPLRVIGAVLVLLSIGIVGDGAVAEKGAVVAMALAVVALRAGPTRCLVCGAEDERDDWRFCGRCGTPRGKRVRG